MRVKMFEWGCYDEMCYERRFYDERVCSNSKFKSKEVQIQGGGFRRQYGT